MKSAIKNLGIALVLTTSFAVAHADCGDQRVSLYNEVNAAMHTYPASCRGQGFHPSCDVLFHDKLPGLLNVLNSSNQGNNLRQIASEVNKNRNQIASIVSDAYIGEMDAIIRALNNYARTCAR